MLLSLLPDDLLSTLLSEWIDPEVDLRLLVEQVLGFPCLAQLVAQQGVTVRATKILSESCVDWLCTHQVPVDLWKTDGPASYFSGIHEWRCNGKLHRDDDLPAVLGVGFQQWCQHGKEHRDGDLPAVIAIRYKKWVRHDLTHRDCDRPAIVLDNGTEEWYQSGQRHRDGDRPAVVRTVTGYRDSYHLPNAYQAAGSQSWWQRGHLHRDGGRPAIVCPDGTQLWFEHGLQVHAPQGHGEQL